jgi:hypothetical protein
MTREWSLAPGYVPGPLVWVLLALVIGLAVYEAIGALRSRRSASMGGRRIALAILGLRLLALVALLAFTFELGVRVETVSPAGQRVVVLVDGSKSMALGDATEEGGTTTERHARASALWQRSEAARNAWTDQGLEVEVRRFAVDSTPWPAEGLERLEFEPTGPASDLARALSELREGDANESRPVAGVVVISDGLVARDEAADEHLRAVSTELGVPITTAAVGAPHITDVAIARLRAGEFAFVENVTSFEVDIVAHGLAGETAHVDLLRDGEPVESLPLTLAADGVARRVQFELAPDRTGQFVYEFRVRGIEGEATLDNNRRAFVVKVLRDKVRVLHVAGRPDWDVRALRTLLKRDPNVELLSYYILRDLDDIERADDSAELSLIQFPTEDLFDEQLPSFDLVILHNFDAMRHGVYHRNFARYVDGGGALVLIGGDMGLASGEYADAALSKMLPVDTRHPTGMVRDPFRPRLTEGGRRHPITAWLAESGVGWESLPELDSFNPTALPGNAASIAATPLLVHPTKKAPGGGPSPLLAVAEPGKGRTLVLATGATWRLGFAPDLPLIDGARPYDLLWLGAIRWLLRDKSSERLILETGRPSYVVGEPVELRARTLSASYASEPDVEVEWEIRTLDATERTLVASGRWTTDGLGRADETIPELPVGAYEATARRTDGDGKASDEARRVFLVDAPARELAAVDADPGSRRLEDLAQATGGEAIVASTGDELPARLPLGTAPTDRGQRVDTRRDIPLWDGWLALALLVIALPGEWLLRRRHGQG